LSGAVPVEEALARVAAGGLVGYPTETTWGLAADASSEAAVAALRRFKARDAAKPISLLVTGEHGALRLGARLSPDARRLIGAFWPGPLTLVVSCDAKLATGIAGPGGAVGLRCSPHPVAHALAVGAEARGIGPLTATSLNLSGEPDCTTRAAAEALARGEVVLVLGPDAGGAPPSSVVDATGPRAKLLREGAIPASRIHAILAGGPAS
jgi:L-threonylcarbamoyladenylate synthase